jgi:polysaccharide export outer membrane protein
MKIHFTFDSVIAIVTGVESDIASWPAYGNIQRNCSLLKSSNIAIIAAVSGMLFSACQGPSPTLPPRMAAPTTVLLAPGDSVKVVFSGASELNQSQKIRLDGKLSLPLVGEVAAAGKRPDVLQSELSHLYKTQLENSDVFVTLESSAAHVIVSGYVAKPGTLSLERPTTVLQAIMEAGGSTEYGSLKRVHLIRVANGEQQTQILDLSAALSGKTTRALYVKDGDVIYVPQSFF